MIIELHLLQSFPVSNLNRDDIGQPKTATFGGQLRARISSQSLKRAARQLFDKHGLAAEETGIRTKRLVRATAAVMKENGRDEAQAAAVAEAGLRALGFGFGKEQRTQYLLFVGQSAATLLAEFCEREWDRLAAASGDDNADKADKIKPNKDTQAEAKRILDASRVVDVALFGRMIADNRDFNVNAASQVAHALSTHAVVNEFDYYTAVDDLQPDDESGADMIGTVDFNSACYYRYANLDLDQLAKNLPGDTDLVPRAAAAWLNSFIDAIPGGKQNSMAALNPPETLLAVVRERGCWNLANAFLKPVTARDSDLLTASTGTLLDHFGRLRHFYGDGTIRSVVGASVTMDSLPGLPESETAQTRDELVSRTLDATEA